MTAGNTHHQTQIGLRNQAFQVIRTGQVGFRLLEQRAGHTGEFNPGPQRVRHVLVAIILPEQEQLPVPAQHDLRILHIYNNLLLYLQNITFTTCFYVHVVCWSKKQYRYAAQKFFPFELNENIGFGPVFLRWSRYRCRFSTRRPSFTPKMKNMTQNFDSSLW